MPFTKTQASKSVDTSVIDPELLSFEERLYAELIASNENDQVLSTAMPADESACMQQSHTDEIKQQQQQSGMEPESSAMAQARAASGVQDSGAVDMSAIPEYDANEIVTSVKYVDKEGHPYTRYQCGWCEMDNTTCHKEYSKKSDCTRHIRSDHEQLVHVCPYCEDEFAQLEHAKLHYRAVHCGGAGHIFGCGHQGCSRRFADRSQSPTQTTRRLHINNDNVRGASKTFSGIPSGQSRHPKSPTPGFTTQPTKSTRPEQSHLARIPSSPSRTAKAGEEETHQEDQRSKITLTSTRRPASSWT
ncbi:MAG: hypothetical protein M1828_001030 [Chrysothrix sp. TS-e1954]|nr:MAG: hypothetical protein M1828_001030 [Chrysothrix sp. TS-e1954]